VYRYNPAEFGGDLPADTGVLLDRLNEQCECVIGAAGQVSGYLAFGTSMDYLYQELKVPYPLTIEVWGENGEGKRPKKTGMLRGGGGHRRRAMLEELDGRSEAAAFVVGEEEGEGGEREGGELAAQAQGHARSLRFSHSADKCIRMFNPAKEYEYREVIANWVNAILLFAVGLYKLRTQCIPGIA
jgi:hypothetical protein